MSSVFDIIQIAFQDIILNFLDNDKNENDLDNDYLMDDNLFEVVLCDDEQYKIVLLYEKKTNSYNLALRWENESVMHDTYFTDGIQVDENNHHVISIQIARFIKKFLDKENRCKCCLYPLNFATDLTISYKNSHPIVDMHCKNCGDILIKELYKIININNYDTLECDICSEKLCKKKSENKITILDFNIVNCCNGKILCSNCINKKKDKCFFCRQDFKSKNIACNCLRNN
jgi:hypothetical protein